MNKSLIACNVLFALNSQTIQDEIKLAITGKWQGHVAGDFELNLEDLQQMKTNFDNAKVDLVIDLDHATVIEGTGEAYGWIKEFEIKDEELWAKVEWLEHGKELIKTGKYKYISPVFQKNTIDQTTGKDIGWTIHSAALTNRPFLEDLGELVANNNQINKKENTGMTPEDKAKMEALEKENKDLKDKETAAESARVEKEVDDAIAANKVVASQKDSLIAFGKSNPEGLTSLLTNAKVIVTKPEDDVYSNNNQGAGNQKYNVLKLGGIE